MKKLRCKILGHKYVTVHINTFGSSPGYNSTSTTFQCIRCNKLKTLKYDEYTGKRS